MPHDPEVERDWADAGPHRDVPEDDHDPVLCVDCEAACEPIEDGLFQCTDEDCGVVQTADGDYADGGMSDYAERMHERRQMGFCDF